VIDLTRDTLLLNPRHNNNPSKNPYEIYHWTRQAASLVSDVAQGQRNNYMGRHEST
jgi:hypothetical protein